MSQGGGESEGTLAIRVRFTIDELAALDQARRKIWRATYAQDAVMWLTERAEGYLSFGDRTQLTQQLGYLLHLLRPRVDRHRRVSGGSFELEFDAGDLRRIDYIRGGGDEPMPDALPRASYAYLAILLRAMFDQSHNPSPSLSLLELVHLVEREIGSGVEVVD